MGGGEIFTASEFHSFFSLSSSPEVDGWKHEGQMAFGYDFADEDDGIPSAYVLHMFKNENNDRAYDITLVNQDNDEGDYGIPFGAGSFTSTSFYPRPNQFTLWLQAYYERLSSEDDMIATLKKKKKFID